MKNIPAPCPLCGQPNPPAFHNSIFYECRCGAIYLAQTPGKTVRPEWIADQVCECGRPAAKYTMVRIHICNDHRQNVGRIGPILLCDRCADLELTSNPQAVIRPLAELPAGQQRDASSQDRGPRPRPTPFARMPRRKQAQIKTMLARVKIEHQGKKRNAD